MPGDVEILGEGEALALTLPGMGRKRFHAVWLRDNAWDETTRAPGNGQKLITVQDISPNTRVSAATRQEDRLLVTFEPGQQIIAYDVQWLADNAYDHIESRPPVWTATTIETWDATFGKRIPTANIEDVSCNDTQLGAWLYGVRRYGFGKLTGGAAQSEALLQIVALFGYVRETNYGRHFEVRANINPSNLAYTGLGLQAHTDNPYRDPVPTLQMLYCLENSAEGGETVVVDGFRAAGLLREKSPHGFHLLTRYCAKFEYAGEPGVCLRARRPVIELTPDGEMVCIRFNNRSAAAMTDVPYADMTDYYDAYRLFAEIINDPALGVAFKLAPGEGFVVDNTRVLHARTAYSGVGSRWLQGCYADKDGLLSKLAAMETQQKNADRRMSHPTLRDDASGPGEPGNATTSPS